MPNDERLTFSLPRPEREALTALAQAQDRSVAQLCRAGVRAVLAHEQPQLGPVRVERVELAET